MSCKKKRRIEVVPTSVDDSSTSFVKTSAEYLNEIHKISSNNDYKDVCDRFQHIIELAKKGYKVTQQEQKMEEKKRNEEIERNKKKFVVIRIQNPEYEKGKGKPKHIYRCSGGNPCTLGRCSFKATKNKSTVENHINKVHLKIDEKRGYQGLGFID